MLCTVNTLCEIFFLHKQSVFSCNLLFNILEEIGQSVDPNYHPRNLRELANVADAALDDFVHTYLLLLSPHDALRVIILLLFFFTN